MKANRTDHDRIPYAKPHTIYEEYETFDNLPTEVRRLLNYAPARFAAPKLNSNNDATTYIRNFWVLMNKEFHGWKFLPTDPLE